MPCDSRPRRAKQTLSERKAEVRAAIMQLAAALVAGRVKPAIGPQGAIAFAGWQEEERVGVSDACAYRLLMASGSALAKAKIAAAEYRSGIKVNRQALASGIHSHDGGSTWGSH